MQPRKSNTMKEQPKEGTHVARVVGITDLGHQPAFEWLGQQIESSYKVEITYELTNSLMEDGRPFHVSEQITNSDNIKATLRIRAESIGADINHLESFLGKPCSVTVKHNDKGYANVKGQAAVGGIPSGMPVPPLQNPKYIFELAKPDMDLWDKMPEFRQKKILSGLDLEKTELGQQLLKRGVSLEKEES